MGAPEVPQMAKAETVKGEPQVALTAEAQRIFGSSAAAVKEAFDGINNSLDQITNEFLKVPKEISMEHAELVAQETAQQLDDLMRTSIQQILDEGGHLTLDNIGAYGHLDALVEDVRKQAVETMNHNIQYALEHQKEFKILQKFEEGGLSNLDEAMRSDVQDALDYSGLPKVEVIADLVSGGTVISRSNVENFMIRNRDAIENNKGEGIASSR